MNPILLTILILTAIGVVAALLLYVVSQRFRVVEDPRIDAVEALLPGANCGGCGRNGCREFAVACVKATTLSGLTCPGSSAETMRKIASIVGLDAVEAEKKVAVVRCYGTCANRPIRASYDGVHTCAVLQMVAVGTQECSFGCLGCGDCVAACPYGAMTMDPTTGLPAIDQDKCVGCGVCAAKCPRHIIELRPRGKRDMRVYVACANKLRGALAMKDCRAACIGCGKCVKTCPFEAITLKDNLAWIDPAKCRLCRKCVAVCPTHAIHAVNFPTPLPPAAPKPAAAAPKPAAAAPKPAAAAPKPAAETPNPTSASSSSAS